MDYVNNSWKCNYCNPSLPLTCPFCGSPAVVFSEFDKGKASCGVCYKIFDLSCGDVADKTFEPPKVDPNFHVFSSGTLRQELKPRYDLIPFEAFRRLALTYTEGAKKYGDNNWKNGGKDFLQDVPNHIIEHLMQWISGCRSEDHLAHAAWGLFTLMYFEEKERKTTAAYL